MQRRAGIAAASRLEAPAERVWEHAVSPEGINAELRPLMRMTIPRGLTLLDPESIELGRPIGRSWILLFGFLPFDYDDITLTELDPGRGFVEVSSLLSQRYWRHARTVEPEGEGCVIVDRVSWEPRLPVPGRMLRPLFSGIFAHRHRRLRRRFGGTAVDRAPSSG